MSGTRRPNTTALKSVATGLPAGTPAGSEESDVNGAFKDTRSARWNDFAG